MEVRGYAFAEVRKDSGMSKGPDLSAFPIPRKGGARPIATDDEQSQAAAYAAHEDGPVGPSTADRDLDATTPAIQPQAAEAPVAARQRPVQKEQARQEPLPPSSSGQVVATTVKLDENRYLRLADAGRPGPGRLKRRTIQEMVVEALDEWFERRGI